jgi:hypothetical protein
MGFLMTGSSKKTLASLLRKVRVKNISNAPDFIVLEGKEFVQIISHFGRGGGGTLITKSNNNPISAGTIEFKKQYIAQSICPRNCDPLSLKTLYLRLYSAGKERLCTLSVSVPGKEYFQKQDISFVKKKSIFKALNYQLLYS